MHSELAGAVLAGGKSSRLGQDKAFLPTEDGDLLVRTVKLLQSVLDEVWLIGRDPQKHALELPWRYDSVVGQSPIGPLGGIVTALEATGKSCLILACDLPLLTKEHLLRLVEAWKKRNSDTLMTTYEQAETGYVETLVAIYEPEALPLLRDAALKNLKQTTRVILPNRRHTIVYTRDEAKPFMNINFPEDLHAWQNDLNSFKKDI